MNLDESKHCQTDYHVGICQTGYGVGIFHTDYGVGICQTIMVWAFCTKQNTIFNLNI